MTEDLNMKTRWTVAAVAAIVLLGMAADAGAQARVTAGLVGGLTRSWVFYDPTPDFDLKGRMEGQVFVLMNVRVNDIVSLETRLGWARTSILAVGDVTDDPAVGEAEVRAKIDHLVVPVLLRLRVPRGGPTAYALLGMEVGAKFHAESVLSVAGMEIEDPDFDDNTRESNLAIDVGGGIEIPVGRRAVLLEALYAHGVRDITAGREPDEPGVRTRNVRVSVGFRF